MQVQKKKTVIIKEKRGVAFCSLSLWVKKRKTVNTEQFIHACKFTGEHGKKKKKTTAKLE